MFRTKTPFEGSCKITCRHCGKSFYVLPGFRDLVRYCSKKCQKTYNNQKYHSKQDPDNDTQPDLADNDNLTDKNTTMMDLQEKLYTLQQDYSDLKLKFTLMERDYSGFQDLKKINQDLQATVNDLTRDFTTEKTVSERLSLENKALKDQVAELALGFIISGKPGRTELPISDFTKNIKNDSRFTQAGSFETRILNRWILRKKAGSIMCEVVKL